MQLEFIGLSLDIINHKVILILDLCINYIIIIITCKAFDQISGILNVVVLL